MSLYALRDIRLSLSKKKNVLLSLSLMSSIGVPLNCAVCVAFKEARLIFKCRKLYCDQLRENSFIDKSILETWYPSRDLHKIFIGEIEEVWEE